MAQEDGRLLPIEAQRLRAAIVRNWRTVNRFCVMNQLDTSYITKLLGPEDRPGSLPGKGASLGQLRGICEKARVGMWELFAPEGELPMVPPKPTTVQEIGGELEELGRLLRSVGIASEPTPQELAVQTEAMRQQAHALRAKARGRTATDGTTSDAAPQETPDATPAPPAQSATPPKGTRGK